MVVPAGSVRKTWVRAGETGAGCCAIAAPLSPTANAATGISFDVRRTAPVIRSVFISVLRRLLRINISYILLVASTEQKSGFRAMRYLSDIRRILGLSADIRPIAGLLSRYSGLPSF